MSFAYKKTVVDSWHLFQNKILWVLGLFISEATIFTSFNFDKNSFQIIREFFQAQGFFAGLKDLFLYMLPNLGVFIWLAMVLAIIFGLYSLICKAGLINGLKTHSQGKSVKFIENLKFGWTKILPMFILEIILAIPNLLLVFAMILLSATAMNLSVIFALFSGLLLLYNIIIAMFRHYSYCEICFENKKALDALKIGFALFMKNFKVTFLVNLIKLGLWVGQFIATLILTLVATIPFILLVFLTSYLKVWVIPFIVAAIGLLVALAVVFAIKSLRSAYFYAFLTKTYWELK
jgi:hypothetical protein